jgi:glutathione S-transferase
MYVLGVPPASDQPRLITLSISPFNELGRWSLERAGVAYREEPKALVQHVLASRRVGGKGTTPVLVADGEVIGESVEIAQWADGHAQPGHRLYPEGPPGDEVKALVKRFAEELGPASRRVIWRHLINDLDLVCRSWEQGLSPGQARFQRLATRFAKRPMRKAMKLTPQELEAAPGIVRSHFDDVGERVAGGGRIVGDSITAADIAFAAMASPAILPPVGYPVRVPQPEEFPEDVAATIRDLREHPAGQYALRMYREERL